MINRIGPRMHDVIAFVRTNPGRAMLRAARYVGPNGSLKYGYRTVHRALRAGLIRKERGDRGSWRLYPAT